MARTKGQPSPPHSEEVKAAVIAALLAGQGIDEVAKQYNLPYTTVYGWHRGLSVAQLEEVRNKRRDEIGNLLLGYLRETLVTLRVQAVYFRNESWLSKQSAADVAILHGVAADKSIRLLEAIERANQGAQADAELSGDTPKSLAS